MSRKNRKTLGHARHLKNLAREKKNTLKKVKQIADFQERVK